MSKAPLILVGVLTAAAIGTGGHFLLEYRACAELKGSYMDTIRSVRRDYEMDMLLARTGQPGPSDDLKRLRELRLELIARKLTAIYERCGRPAGDAVTREGETILFDAGEGQ